MQKEVQDFLTQSELCPSNELKHFHRCVIKAQRFARSFIQCSRCRVRLLFLRLTKSLRISKTDPSNQEHLQSGLEMLRNFGKHLVYQMLAKLRKAYIISRKDYFRRIKENDTAPGFSEIDIWHVKEFLMEGVDSLPPQYRGDFMSRPLFRLFSRQYLDQELKELCILAL
ncbi:MAG: hypothetical protein EBZ48_16415, partial [Proteobacteria bacterium]|nr:hypothetical protein [Pseudomonadota bacterium]